MSYKRAVLIFSITIISIALVYFLVRVEQSAIKDTSGSRPTALPYNWIGNITKAQIAEPSGITYHPTRRSLFLADDSGSVHEVSLEGRLIQSKGLNERDIEGITVDPSTGLLYAAVEDDEVILELEPENLAIQRQFRISRDFKGEQLLRKGGMGIEAIAFVPDASHPEGGTFWVGNQSFSLKAKDEPSVVCEVVVPLRSTTAKMADGTIIRAYKMNFIDISGLAYDAQGDYLVLISDTTNLLVELKREGTILRQYLLPGDEQEGIVLDGLGYMYVAQENGKIIKLADRRLR
ncbi:MAG: SdiA-regulated domain-containing protein [Candidatus Poribacteria bacterium]|nr:SdiA-regulated domain-containing protein [Candidatus Poribacteria bacterium]